MNADIENLKVGELAVVPETLPPLPDPDEPVALVPDSIYDGLFIGKRYTYKFGEQKVQMYFCISGGDYGGSIIEVLLPVKARKKGYGVKSARSKLGRCLIASTGNWRAAFSELAAVTDLQIETRTVKEDGEGRQLHPDDQYSAVERFWSESRRPSNAK